MVNFFFFLTKLLVSVVLIALIFLNKSLYSVSLTTYFTASLSLLKSAGAGTNISTSNLSTSPFKLFKPVGTFFNLPILSNLSTSDFKLTKSTFSANFALDDFGKYYFGKYSLVFIVFFINPTIKRTIVAYPFNM